MKAVIIALFLFSIPTIAQDRIFTYTYQSNVLNKGQRELEVWTTVHQGKNDYFKQIKNRVEYEVGLGSNLQVAFYLNSKQKSFFESGIIVTEPTEISISNEWKYKFSDPVADAFGFAGYGEISVATDELEVELKAIFDKKIGRTLHAVNLILEPEWKTTTEDNKVKTESEIKYDINYAFSYNINKRWNIGAEIINRNVFIKADDFTHSALFAGPTVSFSSDKFWANLSLMPQIVGIKNPENQKGLNLDEFTKFETRLIFSLQL